MNQTKYNFVQFSKPHSRNWLFSAAPFDRKTFDPIAKQEDFRTLSRLRGPGGSRFFTWCWEKWLLSKSGRRLRSAALMSVPFLDSQLNGKVVVDAGCGDSADTDVLSDLGSQAIGYDLFPRKEKCSFESDPKGTGRTFYRSGQFRVQDICERWPNKNESVDIILCNAVLDLMSADDRVLFYREAFRTLKQNGLLIVSIVSLKNGHGFSNSTEAGIAESEGFYVRMNGGVIHATKP